MLSKEVSMGRIQEEPAFKLIANADIMPWVVTEVPYANKERS
jgi:hypothetical protein